MRIVFAGTPPFAAHILTEMLRCGFNVVSVLTQPDAASGRGLNAKFSAVKQLAVAKNIVVQQPATLKDRDAQLAIDHLKPDVIVVVAYGLIFPRAVLELPRSGCVNVHASLLPRWRGAAPIQRALMAGDAETGVCIMRMDEGLDTGPVYERRHTPIRADDTYGTLHDRLAALGAEALCAVLSKLATGSARVDAQSDLGVTYAAKISKADTVVDWHQSASVIERQLRAFDPAPGAATTYAGQPFKVWRGAVVAAQSGTVPPGTILSVGPQGVDVQCGDGVLRLGELQRAGGRRLRAVEFLRGFKLTPGERLGA